MQPVESVPLVQPLWPRCILGTIPHYYCTLRNLYTAVHKDECQCNSSLSRTHHRSSQPKSSESNMDLGPYPTLCERNFGPIIGLYSHCRNTPRHSLYQDFEAIEDFRNHPVESHYFCPDCELYYNSSKNLQEHDLARHHLCKQQ